MGWKNKQFYFALGGGLSEYGDSAQFTRFQDRFTTGATQAFGTIVGPPDNKSWNLNFTGTSKLPLSSTFALNGSYQRNTSQISLLNSIEGGTAGSPTVLPLTVSRGTFNGDVEYWNLAANVTSSPVKDLTTKIYFKYLDRKNESDSVTFTNPASLGSGTVSNALFGYNKTAAGAEGTYRFMKNLKGTLGYDYSNTRREGETDFITNPATQFDMNNVPRTIDNIYKGEIAYNPTDWLGARLKYQKLLRNTDTILQTGNLLTNSSNRFDVGAKNQDMWKLTGDLTPIEALDVALEYAYKRDSYNGNILGFQEAEENEFILDGNYMWNGMKFFAFFDYDVTTQQQYERQGGGNPGAAPTVTAFNWNANMRNDNYAYGIGATFPIIKNKLAFNLQYDFEKNNGTADFTAQSFTAAQTTAGVNNGNIDIAPWDDYTRQSISATVNYAFNKDMTFVFGYLYSQFRLNDGQLNGYAYVPSSSVNLTGAYIDQNYKVNAYYVKLYYRF